VDSFWNHELELHEIIEFDFSTEIKNKGIKSEYFRRIITVEERREREKHQKRGVEYGKNWVLIRQWHIL
jgi:hypothetical protein